MEREKIKAYAAFTSVSFFWGTTYLAIKIGVEVMPPLLFTGFRFLIAAALFIPVLLWRGYKFPAWDEFGRIAIVGILLLTFANTMVAWSEQWLDSSIAALIVATLPFWMAGIDAALPQGQRMTAQKVLGISIGFSGLVLLLWPDLRAGVETTYLHGIIVILLAPVSWSIGSIYGKYNIKKTPPLMSAACQMLVAGVALVVAGTGVGELGTFRFSQQGMLAMLYLALFGSIVGFGSYIYALDKLSASVVSMYAYLNPVVAVLLGWLILDERLDLLVVTATAIILTGVIIVNKAARRKRSPVPQPTPSAEPVG